MAVSIKDLEFDLKQIPEVPCSIYFYNKQMEVEPKQMFTVTRKRINHEKAMVELYIMEQKKFIPYSESIYPVIQVCPN